MSAEQGGLATAATPLVSLGRLKSEPEWKREARERLAKRIHARFPSTYIPALASLVIDDTWVTGGDYRGLQVEPAEEGGVYLITTDGRNLAVVYEKNGEATAPFVLDLPKRFVKACIPPKAPVLYDVNCEAFEPPLPPWLIPGQVSVWADPELPIGGKQEPFCCVLVQPAGDLPEEVIEISGKDGAGHYSSGSWHGLLQRPMVPWRKILRSPREDAPTTGLLISAPAFGILARFKNIAARLRLGGHQNAVIFECDEREGSRIWIATMPVAIKAATTVTPMVSLSRRAGPGPSTSGGALPMHDPLAVTLPANMFAYITAKVDGATTGDAFTADPTLFCFQDPSDPHSAYVIGNGAAGATGKVTWNAMGEAALSQEWDFTLAGALASSETPEESVNDLSALPSAIAAQLAAAKTPSAPAAEAPAVPAEAASAPAEPAAPAGT